MLALLAPLDLLTNTHPVLFPGSALPSDSSRIAFTVVGRFLFFSAGETNREWLLNESWRAATEACERQNSCYVRRRKRGLKRIFRSAVTNNDVFVPNAGRGAEEVRLSSNSHFVVGVHEESHKCPQPPRAHTHVHISPPEPPCRSVLSWPRLLLWAQPQNSQQPPRIERDRCSV